MKSVVYIHTNDGIGVLSCKNHFGPIYTQLVFIMSSVLFNLYSGNVKERMGKGVEGAMLLKFYNFNSGLL